MILMVCYDGSAEAQRALETAIDRAKGLGATLYIATSIEKGLEKDETYIKKAEEDLAQVKTLCETSAVPVETQLLFHAQSPGADLLEFADKNKVDEIVIGIKKISKVGKLLFGSTAQWVILDANCPVLTVK